MRRSSATYLVVLNLESTRCRIQWVPHDKALTAVRMKRHTHSRKKIHPEEQ